MYDYDFLQTLGTFPMCQADHANVLVEVPSSFSLDLAGAFIDLHRPQVLVAKGLLTFWLVENHRKTIGKP